MVALAGVKDVSVGFREFHALGFCGIAAEHSAGKQDCKKYLFKKHCLLQFVKILHINTGVREASWR